MTTRTTTPGGAASGAAPGGAAPGGATPDGAVPGAAPAPGAGPGAARPGPAAPPGGTARPLRRSGHVGPVSVAQIVVAEAALLLAVFAATRGPVPGALGGTVAAVLLTACFARRRGRWWLEERLIAVRYARRRRRAAAATGAGPVPAALRALAPGLAVRDVSAPDGARVGVARDEAGWYAAVALGPDPAPLPLDVLAGVLAEVGQPGLVVQQLTVTVPAPGPGLPAAAPAAVSYRQLAGTPPVPAYRESTVAVRLDARRYAETVPDPDADADTATALVAALGRRTATTLRRRGAAGRVLDAAGLLAAVGRACDVTAGTTAREEPTRWHSARLAHRTFWVAGWPEPAARLGPLLHWAAGLPAAQTAVALVCDPRRDGDVAVRALVRLAAAPDALDGLSRLLLDGAAEAGASLVPFDGEQAPAVYATAPTGGGPR